VVIITIITIVILITKQGQTPRTNDDQQLQNLDRNTSSKMHIEFSALEIKMNELKILEKLGKGAYGVVFKASYRKSNVAVKMLEIETEGLEEFLKEAITMA